MFGTFELRLVAIVTVPIVIVATNGLMSLAILVIVILDYARRSPLGILSEIILCAAAGGVDLIAAIAMLLMKSSDAVCRTRSGSEFWNACGAHFATIVLLWTAAALLFIYTVALLYATKQYQALHPSEKGSIWKQTVKGVRWSREAYTINSPPGRRLRKKGPLEIESLRRVIPDKDSVTSSRDILSSPLPATPSRSTAPIRPPGLNSPTIGFAGRMGYLRRDAMGEYVPSAPALHRGPQPGYYHPGTRQEAGHDAVFRMQNPMDYRRPSFPDLPNPFPPQPVPEGPMRFTQPVGNFASRSRTPSHSSGSTGNSSPGFAGLGAGTGSHKDGPRISIPMPLVPLHIHGSGPVSAKSIQNPRVSMLVAGGQQRPFRVSMPMPPTGGPSPTLPRMSLQSSRYPPMPANQIRQPGARPQYSTVHQPARLHHSLIPPVSVISAPEVVSNSLVSQTRPRAGSASSVLSELPSPFLPVPPPAMSPSTKQRVSNQAYPLPLPPLSTYPIKSVAMSAGTAKQPGEAWTTRGALPHDTFDGQSAKDRPLSTVSTMSIYSTSSASHGPPPSQEHLAAASLVSVNASTESETTKGSTTQRSDSTSSRRSLKSKKAPTLARAPSHHGVASQNLWGGTGNGQMRRNLASQFQQPQVRAIL